MSYPKSITKEEINSLPILKYQGEIKLISDLQSAQSAAQHLQKEKILGFDTETRPAFVKGQKYKVSLLQLASEHTSYVFQLKKIGLIKPLVNILADPKIIKTGVAVRDDIIALQGLSSFDPGNFIDLATEAKSKGIQNFGLNALTAIFFQHRLSKKIKTSNWEKEHLTPAQIHYAALDAWVGLQIYKKMMT